LIWSSFAERLSLVKQGELASPSQDKLGLGQRHESLDEINEYIRVIGIEPISLVPKTRILTIKLHLLFEDKCIILAEQDEFM
jgi:hypothetical protein